MQHSPLPPYENGLKRTLLVLLGLCILTAIAYAQTGYFDFINYDDGAYISDNSRVQDGLSWDNTKWAFGFSDSALKFYYHPLTWLSLMLDVEMFGLYAGGSHIVNALFHALNVILLFLALRQMTGGFWRSAAVAALFAVHPLNVESVAWISERKNVLSTLFWMLCLLAYTSYAKKPDVKKYLLIFVPFILGLLAKPMLVTIPCVFLLLDFWPLKRMQISAASGDYRQTLPEPGFPAKTLKWLILEKIPFLAVSICSVAVSIFAVHQTGQILSETVAPMALRISNAVVVYIKYLGKLVWPHDMAIFYPFPESIPAWQVIMAGIAIAVITIATLILAKKASYLVIGWLWYLGTLFPIIGVFQSGRWPEMADRWLYVPAIGLFLIAAWGAADLLKKFRVPKVIGASAAGLISAALLLITTNQVAFWQNSRTLFAHTLAVTKNNYVAHYNYGTAVATAGDLKQAVTHFKKTLTIKPDKPEPHTSLGNALGRMGRTEEAIYHFKQAIKGYKDKTTYYSPSDRAIAYYNIANAYAIKRKSDKAVKHFKKAQSLDPDYSKAADIQALISRLPSHDSPKTLFKQAVRHISSQQYDAAIKKLKAILEKDPANQPILYNIACVYSMKNQNKEAGLWLQKAISKGYDNWEHIKTDPDLKNLRESKYYEEILKENKP